MHSSAHFATGGFFLKKSGDVHSARRVVDSTVGLPDKKPGQRFASDMAATQGGQQVPANSGTDLTDFLR